MTRYILSSVGASLLTKNAGDLANQLLKTANLREADLSPEQRSVIDNRIAKVRQLLLTAELKQLREYSAELNGLYGLCGEQLFLDDLHFLLATDTYQGQATAGLLEEFLKRQGISSVQIIVPKRLSTRSQADFTSGIREVIRFCEDTFGTCREARVPVLFNLVGSFKSLQGYLNTIGMFYKNVWPTLRLCLTRATEILRL